jgi:uncharacterized YigZ family protein
MEDHFKTIALQADGYYKDRGSKFIARIYPAETAEDCKNILIAIKKEFHDARHHCYAYRIQPEDEEFRSNDDGEPSGTAGKPILNQLYSNELFNVVLIVVRYFGGTKLGTSGLINAYKTAAQEAIKSAKIVKRYITRDMELHFEYPLMNDVMRIIKEENLEIIDQFYDKNCVIKLTVNKSKLVRVESRMKKLLTLEFKVLKSNNIS